MEKVLHLCESLRSMGVRVPSGTFCGGIEFDFQNYKLYAYPGPNVVSAGRAEHLPLHVHVKGPGETYRISLEDFSELDRKKIPKDLIKHLIRNRTEIQKRTESMFSTGKF